MDRYELSSRQISDFARHLKCEERAQGTIDKYLRDVSSFAGWLDGREVTKEVVVQWKEALLSGGDAPATVNSKLSAVNSLFRFLGWEECRVRFLKIQRQLFRDNSRELTRAEYGRLLDAARGLGRERLAMLIETMCATGIRVSEVRYITVESAKNGMTEISMKGKIRTILLQEKLCRKLLKYARKNRITSGEIFVTRDGGSLSRKQIWAEMKALCRQANVEPTKVFPHNLRHLFARTFYRVCQDVVRLADVLGHSHIETTRIYLVFTAEEHVRQMERLGLVS